MRFRGWSCCLCDQNPAYEMRGSDWSSDVCSSDLHHHVADGGVGRLLDRLAQHQAEAGKAGVAPVHLAADEGEPLHVLLAVLGAAAPVQEPALAQAGVRLAEGDDLAGEDRKSTRLNSSH